MNAKNDDTPTFDEVKNEVSPSDPVDSENTEAVEVTVEPSGAPTREIHGKTYEVTPEGGFRLLS